MLNLDNNNAAFQIQGYQPGRIQVNDQTFTHSMIISANKLIDNWEPQEIAALKAEHLSIILTFQPTLLLLGTGSSLEFPDIEIYGDLINQGIGVEIMNTSAACHTFSILTSEGRNVVAALFIK